MYIEGSSAAGGGGTADGGSLSLPATRGLLTLLGATKTFIIITIMIISLYYYDYYYVTTLNKQPHPRGPAAHSSASTLVSSRAYLRREQPGCT